MIESGLTRSFKEVISWLYLLAVLRIWQINFANNVIRRGQSAKIMHSFFAPFMF